MAYKNLNEFITNLEESGDLVRIKNFVDPRFEMTEIADRMVKADGMALLFENTGTEFPVLMNAFATDRRMCQALGIADLDQPAREMQELFKEISTKRSGFFEQLGLLGTLKQLASWMPVRRSRKGECQEVVMPVPDLGKLPILTCWPADGGPFITLPVVHTRDAVTGTPNAGMYRMQVYGPDTTGMHWHLHKNSARHYRQYKELGKRMPVSVTLGGDPAYTYAATAPLPDHVDEMMLAGFLRKRKVELVKCLTNDLEVPSDVDFVIEGYVDPAEDLRIEGPFGDHTGFYSLADKYPVFHVSCITHRKGAVYPATIVGIPPQEDAWIGKATERIFLYPIRLSMLPEIRDMHMPVEGVFHNIVIVSIKKEYEGQPAKVMNALWGAGQMMFNKIMLVVDEQVNVRNYAEVMKMVLQETDPAHDIYYSRGPADVLDHSSHKFAYGGKMGLDATCKEIRKTLPSSMPLLTPLSEKLKCPYKVLPDFESLLFVFPVQETEIRSWHEQLCSEGILLPYRYVFYMDHECADLDTGALTWIIANHIDPVRDCTLWNADADHPVMGIDATSKNSKRDGFDRDWPNPVVMSEDVIRSIDQKWPELMPGALIPSPSLKYRPLLRGEAAVAIHNTSEKGTDSKVNL
jgi:4-hydroxy-3-polyprenylbenzoate decarboxylase